MDRTFTSVITFLMIVLFHATSCKERSSYVKNKQSFLNYSKTAHIFQRKRRLLEPEVEESLQNRKENFRKISLISNNGNDENTMVKTDQSFIIPNISNGKQSVTPNLKLSEAHINFNKASLTRFTTLNWQINDSMSSRASDGCLVYESREDIVADCSNASLTSIPQYLPQNITYLRLENNLLDDSALFQRVFARYSKLKILNLGSNNISTLPEGAFEGLEQLASLNVYNNSIAMNSKLNSSKVFAPLNATLRSLHLHRNNPNPSLADLMYPDFAVSFLSKLLNLSIDGLKGKDFGFYFGKLTNLIYLNLSGFYWGYCNLDNLTNKTFKYLIFVKYLNISGCNINGSQVETGALEHLTELFSLDMSNNYNLGLEAVGNLMYGMRNSKKFKNLYISRVVERFKPCVLVLTSMLKYFKTTSIEGIYGMNNEIEMIEYGALEMLPPTLEIVSLVNNKIMFGAYWKNMAKLVGLKTLILDGKVIPTKFPNTFPEDKFHCYKQADRPAYEDEPGMCGNDIRFSHGVMLPLPPNLRTFAMHRYSLSYNVGNLSFCPNNSLAYVDLSSNHFQSLSGPVSGLNRLKTLNLSSCLIENIGSEFFDDLTSLEELYLFENLLADCLNDDLNGFVFDKLTNLRILNLSLNNLYRLNADVFADMHKLEVLDLSMNSLTHANFSIKSMARLRKIDLHKNGLASLSQEMREHISSLLDATVNISVDMRENPLECDCDNLDFLKWVVDTNVFGNNLSLYYCTFSTPNQQSVEMTQGFEQQVILLTYSCHLQMSIFFTVMNGTLMFVLAMVIALLYRFRWTFRYWYHAAKSKMSAYKKTDKSLYTYDVFVSYASADIDFILEELCPKLKERNVKLLIHGEKFKVGRYIADNIYEALVNSRRTLLVVTKHLLASHWCNYELQMARLESISTGRDVLVFIFLEEIPTTELGKQVLSHIRSSTYMVYPKVLQQRVPFWDKLADDLLSI
ncbi:hypothetical protein Btru_067448 [Bulinus truncatus]|nr:hypothetical protein Btru_067448 [Bulinus truncatus]